MQHLKGGLPADLDPLQFAYRHIVQQQVQYLPHCTSLYRTWRARTLIPGEEKLISLNVDTGTCNWNLNLLTQRQQTVWGDNRTSKPNTVSTGSPQGCVLSPSLISVLTKVPSVSTPTTTWSLLMRQCCCRTNQQQCWVSTRGWGRAADSMVKKKSLYTLTCLEGLSGSICAVI